MERDFRGIWDELFLGDGDGLLLECGRSIDDLCLSDGDALRVDVADTLLAVEVESLVLRDDFRRDGDALLLDELFVEIGEALCLERLLLDDVRGFDELMPVEAKVSVWAFEDAFSSLCSSFCRLLRKCSFLPNDEDRDLPMDGLLTSESTDLTRRVAGERVTFPLPELGTTD